ncbi:uncharacterized protein LOC130451497 [Diorhabda sublineata]|uniref:uncharacterized protein LOC130451497 n=1 Tax=Diorhabda sublineata TaxID=1163346 RepID=UPI0024E06A50|nr:uncharacterized protein LOC130451497 [Diorhabda sublineata]
MKPLSDTRWESRIQAVKEVLLQFDDVFECIENLKCQTEQSDTLSDCDYVLNEMFRLEFIILHIWYELLTRVNTINKLWQSVQVHLRFDFEDLRTFCNWIKAYRQTGVKKFMSDARQFVERSSRVAKKKRMFDNEGSDQYKETVKSRYETEFFSTMIDYVISNMILRFMSLNQHFENSKRGDTANLSGTILQVRESSDFQPYELYEELQNMIPNLPNTIKDVKHLLQYIIENYLKEIYPNINIVIRLLLTIPLSTASAGRSYSKLILVKNHL